jgi:predicted DNA-binding transcriptional regulator YafY
MSESAPRPGRWGQERRLEFIDFRLLWEGRLNRADLTSFFKISVPQASLDLAKYQELAPSNMLYDRVQKTYVATEDFQPLLAKADCGQYLSELLWRIAGTVAHSESFVGWAPPVDFFPYPGRKIDQLIFIPLLRAIQKQTAIVIGYQSMRNPEPADRLVFPLAFAQDGYRWHLRAYCYSSQQHKDFVLGRIFSVGAPSTPADPVPEDTEWNSFVDVVIGPNPSYSEAKKLAISRDYNMTDGEARIRTRRAQLYYLKRRLNITESDAPPAEHQQIVLVRIEAV